MIKFAPDIFFGGNGALGVIFRPKGAMVKNVLFSGGGYSAIQSLTVSSSFRKI